MAIEAKDLRSGNLILNRHGEVVEVDWMTLKNMCQPRMSGHGYTGIPLTPEWLERMGFRRTKSNQYRTECYFMVEMECGSIYYRHNLILCEGVEFVHQLQNLYHALIGKELEVKP